MAGTTPRFAYPYPTGSDRVADGDNAMQALAEKIEHTLGIESVITLGNGAAAMDTPGLSVYLFPGFVILRVFATNAGALAANTAVATLPASIYPKVRVLAPIMQFAPSVGLQGLDLQTNGAVLITVASPAGAIWGGAVTYPLLTQA